MFSWQFFSVASANVYTEKTINKFGLPGTNFQRVCVRYFLRYQKRKKIERTRQRSDLIGIDGIE
jgi:hypothetical protein